VIDAAAAKQLAEHWDAGWNGEDIDRIMAPFATGVTFTSPFVARITDPPVTSIEGDEALREYCAGALRRTPGIRYRIDAVHLGTDTLVLDYTVSFPDGRPDTTGADLMRIDDDGKVFEWRSHYPVTFVETPLHDEV
jgi:predicted SnoaL-like aldol condensation-catalyzing enzyme